MEQHNKNLLFTLLREKAEKKYGNDWGKRKYFFQGAEECLNIIENNLKQQKL